MRKIFIPLFLVISINVIGQSALDKKIAEGAKKLEPKLIVWRRDIHEHPELGNLESRTAALIAAHLNQLGLKVQTGIAHTGVVALLKGTRPGPVVALRADMDALPITETTNLPFTSKQRTIYNGAETGVMHACGHDAHVAILMGVAELLSSMKSEIKGTIKFIFQPAEEGVPRGEEGGAELMVKEGVLNNPGVDAIFGLHIKSDFETGKLGYKRGGLYAAVNDMKIIVTGKPSHGAYPWQSVDPIIVAAQIINNIQTIVSRNVDLTKNPAVISIGAINGGNRQNIIPEKVEMLGTIRTFSYSDEEMIIKRIHTIVTKTAEAAGAKAEAIIPYASHYPVTMNDTALTLKMLSSLKQAAGASNVELMNGYTGAEDFSFYEQKIPGMFFILGGMPKGNNPADAAPHHTAAFMIDESSFVLGVKALSTLALDYLNKPLPKK
ncbi:MAG: amidohydrolase [Ferruginibacter sp.]